MVSHLFFSQLVLVALIGLCVMLHWAWPSDPATWPPTPEPTPPVPKRHREPTPFAGLTTKPHYAACEHRTDPHPSPPRLPAPAPGAPAGAPPPSGYLNARRPEPRLCLWELGGPGPSPCQGPAQGRPLATAVG